MDLAAFLDNCRAQWPDFGDATRLASVKHPRDRNLAELLGKVEGMATENKLKLLNLAVAHLRPDEVYVEIGCWYGASLAGAAAGNVGRQIWACDNFSQFGGSSAKLEETLERHTAPGQVEFRDMDFREFFSLAPWRPARIGAYFYDGGHKFSDQFEGLGLALPWFADEAVVIVDDTNKRNVQSANRLFTQCVPGFELVLDIRTPRNHHPTWWNGIQVYSYRRYRGGRSEASLDFKGFNYRWRRWFWDDLVLETRHSRRHLQNRVKGMIRGARPSGKKQDA